jgi:hypothetical protein
LPMALGLWVRRVPWWTPAFTIVCGLVASLSAAFLPQLLGAAPWFYHERIFAVVGTGLIAFFASRHWGGALDPETAAREEQFFALRNRPVDFAHEVGVGNDARQIKIIALFAWALALAFLLLTLPRSSQGHGLKFIVLAATSASIGLLLHWRARRPGPRT